MPTSRAGRWTRIDEGFTLLEVMVVAVLVATLAVVAMPRFQQLLSPDVERDVQRELENLLLAVRSESILSRNPLAILYSVEEGIYRTAVVTADGRVVTEGDPLSMVKRLPEGLMFMDIVTSLEGGASRGLCFTVVWPSGWVEPTTLHIQDRNGRPHTLFIEPISGTVRMEEGYLTRRRAQQ